MAGLALVRLPLAALLLGLALLLLQRPLDQIAIADHVAIARRGGESGVVSLERFAKLAGVGQGIAPVVLRVSIFQRREQLRGLVVLPGAQFGIGLPAWIFGERGRGGGLVGIQKALRLLLACQPQVGPGVRPSGGDRAEATQ